MKKTILIMLIISSLSFTQSKLGIYSGIATMGSSIDDSKRVIGKSIGVDFRINENFSVGGGYGERGYKVNDNSDVHQGLELYVIGNIITNEMYSLWIGPSIIYLYDIDLVGIWYDAGISDPSNNIKKDTDKGIMMGATLEFSNKSFARIGYYYSIDDHITDNMNNLFLQYVKRF